MKFGCLLTYSEYGAVGRDFPEFPPGLLEDIYQVQNGISDFTFVLALMPWAKLVMYTNNTVHQPYVQYMLHTVGLPEPLINPYLHIFCLSQFFIAGPRKVLGNTA